MNPAILSDIELIANMALSLAHNTVLVSDLKAALAIFENVFPQSAPAASAPAAPAPALKL